MSQRAKLLQNFFQTQLARMKKEREEKEQEQHKKHPGSHGSSGGGEASHPTTPRASPSKLIGQGTYGCVYHPGLKCKPGVGKGDELNSKYADNPDYIMKVSSVDAAEVETRVASYVVQIRDSERFFTTVIAPPCQVEVIPELVDACRPYKAAQNSKQIVEGYFMRYRGPSVQDHWKHMPKDVRNIHTLLLFAEHLCRGLSLLHKAGITHFDIKPDNLLITANQDLMAPVTLIDFGMAMVWPRPSAPVHEKLAAIRELMQFSGEYYAAYPPEYQALKQNRVTNSISIVPYEQVIKRYNSKSIPASAWNPLRENWGTDEKKQLTKLQEMATNTWLPLWEKLFGPETQKSWVYGDLSSSQLARQYVAVKGYFQEFDVYGLGVSIYYMFYYLDKPTDRSEQALYDDCLDAIRDMCRVDPNRRFSAEHFVEEFAQIRKKAT